MLFVFLLQIAEHRELVLFVDAFGRRQVQHGRLAGTHGGALIRGRQVAAAPRRRPAFDAAARIGQHHERRHVVVLGAQAVADPTAETGPTHQDRARVHLIHRLRMIHAVAVTTANHAQIVGKLGDLGQQVADFESRLHRAHETCISARAAGWPPPCGGSSPRRSFRATAALLTGAAPAWDRTSRHGSARHA